MNFFIFIEIQYHFQHSSKPLKNTTWQHKVVVASMCFSHIVSLASSN